MLAPLVSRSWAPEGQTPLMYCWDRHDRLSVIGALSRSAQRRRIGLYFAVHQKDVTAEEIEAFLRQVQRSLGRKLIVVIDRWSVRRKAAEALAGDERFWIEWLPPYAPDLNPVEHVWNHTKYGDLAMCGTIRSMATWPTTSRTTCWTWNWSWTGPSTRPGGVTNSCVRSFIRPNWKFDLLHLQYEGQ